MPERLREAGRGAQRACEPWEIAWTTDYLLCGHMENNLPTLDEQAVQRAISAISQSDPLIKLLQQVRLGRMKPTDTGLRAVTEAWLGSYEKALATDGLTQSGLRRLNPAPRLAVLIETGVLTNDHGGVTALKVAYDELLARAPSE